MPEPDNSGSLLASISNYYITDQEDFQSRLEKLSDKDLGYLAERAMDSSECLLCIAPQCAGDLYRSGEGLPETAGRLRRSLRTQPQAGRDDGLFCLYGSKWSEMKAISELCHGHAECRDLDKQNPAVHAASPTNRRIPITLVECRKSYILLRLPCLLSGSILPHGGSGAIPSAIPSLLSRLLPFSDVLKSGLLSPLARMHGDDLWQEETVISSLSDSASSPFVQKLYIWA